MPVGSVRPYNLTPFKIHTSPVSYSKVLIPPYQKNKAKNFRILFRFALKKDKHTYILHPIIPKGKICIIEVYLLTFYFERHLKYK